MDMQGNQYYNTETPRKGSSKLKPILFLVILLVIVGLVIFGTMKFLEARDSALEISPTPTEFVLEPTDEPAPTEKESTGSAESTPTGRAGSPTPRATGTSGLDRSTLKVEILNGSGTAGVAGKVQTILEDLGYTVTRTGNADNFDYEETVINVKATRKNFLSQLEKDLGDDYAIGSTSATLTGTSADAVVIVGKN